MSQMAFDFCQRWHGRTPSYRPAGEPIDPRRYSVSLIDEADARQFVVDHHYSASYPAARCRVGLLRRGRLVGVAVFSQPMQSRAIKKWTGQAGTDGVELGRFVLLDDVPANGETWFLARAFRALRDDKGVSAVYAYADPTPRDDGIMPGHVGTIYQAHNGVYVGRSKPETELLIAGGGTLSRRSLSKIRGGESGAAGARRRLEALGAPARRRGEPAREYVQRAVEALLSIGAVRRRRSAPKHVYAWGLQRRAARVLPDSTGAYPKLKHQEPTRARSER